MATVLRGFLVAKSARITQRITQGLIYTPRKPERMRGHVVRAGDDDNRCGEEKERASVERAARRAEVDREREKNWRVS